MKRVRVLIYPVGENPREERIASDLQTLQGLVGGYIEIVTLERTPDGGSLGLVCNEEGWLIPLPPNRRVPGVDLIAGQFLIVRHDAEGELMSLSGSDIARWRERIP